MTAAKKEQTRKCLLCCMTPLDFRRLDHIIRVNGQRKRAEAIRWSLARQEKKSVADPKGFADLAASVKRSLQEREAGSPMKRHQQSYSGEDFSRMDTLCRIHGLPARAMAIRLAIRAQAKRDGFSDGLKTNGDRREEDR